LNEKNRDIKKTDIVERKNTVRYECVDKISAMENGYKTMAKINLDMAEMGLPVDYKVLCSYEEKVLGDD